MFFVLVCGCMLFEEGFYKSKFMCVNYCFWIKKLGNKRNITKILLHIMHPVGPAIVLHENSVVFVVLPASIRRDAVFYEKTCLARCFFKALQWSLFHSLFSCFRIYYNKPFAIHLF